MDNSQQFTLRFKAQLIDMKGNPRIKREWIPTRLSRDLHFLYDMYLHKTMLADRSSPKIIRPKRSPIKLSRRRYIDHIFVNPNDDIIVTYNPSENKWNNPFTEKAIARLDYGKLGVFTYNMKHDPRWMSATIMAAFIAGLANMIIGIIAIIYKSAP